MKVGRKNQSDDNDSFAGMISVIPLHDVNSLTVYIQRCPLIFLVFKKNIHLFLKTHFEHIFFKNYTLHSYYGGSIDYMGHHMEVMNHLEMLIETAQRNNERINERMRNRSIHPFLLARARVQGVPPTLPRIEVFF